jgi:hypothetical protein
LIVFWLLLCCVVCGASASAVAATYLEFAPYLQGDTEDSFRIEVPIRREGDLEKVSTVTYFTAPGPIDTLAGTATPDVDYRAVSGVLQFAPGESLKVIRIPILYDSEPEMNGESLVLNLADPVGAEIRGSAQDHLYIVNSDPTPHAFDVNVYESAAEAVVRLARGGRPGELPAIAMPFKTRNGRAFSGIDFRGMTNEVIFEENQQEAFVHIPLIDDRAVEADELFFFDLTQPDGTVATTRIRIVNDDPGMVLIVRGPGYIDVAGTLLSNHAYALESSEDLKTWQPIQSTQEHNGYVYFLTPWANTGAKRFFRVRSD